MGEIYSLVYESKRGNKEKVMDLIHKFDSLLNKLQRNRYNEDIKNDFIVFIKKVLKNEDSIHLIFNWNV